MKSEEKIKKPTFIVFTDKDGTLSFDDKKLSLIFKKIQTMNGIVLPITGRTVGDILEEFENNDIPLLPLIIGDNGGAIYSTKTGKFIRKKTIDSQKVVQVIDEFLNIGGNPQLIRCTDGKNIFASKDKKVEEYYKNSSVAIFSEDICKYIQSLQSISKITLAGNKEKMEQMSEFVEKLGFWTDMDKTKFPNKRDKNYRLDITLIDINKGDAVSAVVQTLKPEFYVCIGNRKK